MASGPPLSRWISRSWCSSMRPRPMSMANTSSESMRACSGQSCSHARHCRHSSGAWTSAMWEAPFLLASHVFASGVAVSRFCERARGAECGAHAAARATVVVDDGVPPYACADHDVFRLLHVLQRVKQHGAAWWKEPWQCACLHGCSARVLNGGFVVEGAVDCQLCGVGGGVASQIARGLQECAALGVPGSFARGAAVRRQLRGNADVGAALSSSEYGVGVLAYVFRNALSG